jgi:LuxR family maltose regulon positive regulatory protein
MNLPLLSTKLFLPPVQPGLVSRQRLVGKLDEGLQPGKRLVLVSAPAGYGKTTQVREWIQSYQESDIFSAQMQFAWLSLDEGDNDPLRFWTHLVAALQKIHRVSQCAGSALQSPRPAPIQFILTGLINELILQEGLFVLVLDDYHFISNPQIHTGIAFLVENLPPGLRLVLATRADPPLPVVPLRARRQMVELRAGDLRFTSEEAAAFLNEIMGLGLQAKDIEALEARTEGWAVGLQLAALSMQDRQDLSGFIRAFSGSHFFILEYLAEEVLNRQPEEIRSFLLKTSILERLCGPLCDAVLDEGRTTNDESNSSSVLRHLSTVHRPSSVVLESLHRLNLFLIPLDDERLWYRYHHLFADLLRNQLKQQVPQEDITALHRRASAWYAENSLLDEAVRHGLEAGDFERVAEMVEQAARANMLNGRVATMLHWMDALPEGLRRSQPRLQLYQAWAYFLNGQTDLASRMLLDLKERLSAQTPSDENRSTLGELNAYLATVMSITENTVQIRQFAQEALAGLPPEEHSPRARAFTALGIAYGMDGKMEQSHQALQEAARLAQLAGNVFLYAHILETAAGNYVHQGRLRAAAQVYQEIVKLSEGGEVPQGPGSPAASQGIFLAGIGYLGLAEITLEWNDLELALPSSRRTDLCRQGDPLTCSMAS